GGRARVAQVRAGSRAGPARFRASGRSPPPRPPPSESVNPWPWPHSPELLACAPRRGCPDPIRAVPPDPPELPRLRADSAPRICRARLPRLLDVRGAGPRPAVPRRWPEARAAAHRLRHERAGPERPGQAEEIRAHRRRRDRQVPPARRLGLLRGAGADGAAVLLSLPADRRPGQLRLGRRPEIVRGD